MKNKRSRASLDPSAITTSRRSTRVSRTSTGSSSAPLSSTRRRNARLSTFSHNINKQCRKWTQVLRPPRPGVAFKALVWVPVENLDDDERKVYTEKNEKKRKLNENNTSNTSAPANTPAKHVNANTTNESNSAKDANPAQVEIAIKSEAAVFATPKGKVSFVEIHDRI